MTSGLHHRLPRPHHRPGAVSLRGRAGLQAAAGRDGHGEAYARCSTRHGVGHALLVQPSGYGFDNAAMLDAMAASPGRFRAIAMVDPDVGDAALATLERPGVVGVRFNLVSHDRDALAGPEAARFLARLKELGWFAQVFADDAQWPEVGAAPAAQRREGAGRSFRRPRRRARAPAQPGFQAVLALGRDGQAAVKLSAPFRDLATPATSRTSTRSPRRCSRPSAPDGCVWGSDWPFLDVGQAARLRRALAAAAALAARRGDRAQVLWDNPGALFGFGAAP